MKRTLLFAILLLAALRLRAQSPIEVQDLPSPGGSGQPAAAPAPPPDQPITPTQAAPADQSEQDLQSLESDAQNAYADGDLTRALTLYVEAGDRHPVASERARLHILAAWLAWQQHDEQNARSYLEGALYDDPKAAFRAELYSPEFQAAYQDALAAALARRQRSSAETINRASAALRSGRTKDARQLLGEALQLMPDDPDALYNLALVDLGEGKQDAALSGFERVLSLERGNPEGVSPALKGQALNNSAVIYFERGEYSDAERALTEAVALTPEDSQAWLNLGLTLGKEGRSDESYDALKRARALAPSDVGVSRSLALAEVDRSNWVGAVALLVEATQAQPGDADLRLQLGRAQSGLGNKTGAIDSFKKALELDSDGKKGVAAPAISNLTDLLRAQGDLDGALAMAQRSVELEPRSAAAQLRLGLARYQKGDLQGALDAMTKAEQLEPGRADVAHNLGTVQMAMNDYAGAEASFRKALEKDPTNAETKGALDRVLARQTEIAKNQLARGDLGATLAVAEYKALKIKGLRVDDVPAGSVAARIGLLKGDLVLKVDGKSVETLEELHKRLVGKKNPPLIDCLRQGVPVQLRFQIN